MKIENQGQCLKISEIVELTAVNSAHFRDEVFSARFMDSSGLGALFALYRATGQREGVVLRLLNPMPEIQQLLELTQMQLLFEIVRN